MSQEIPQGHLLMNLILNFSKYVGFKKIKLMDLSNKECNFADIGFKYSRSLRSISLLRFGDTYYGKYGFRPSDETHYKEYEETSKILKRQIKDIINSNEKLHELRRTLENLDKFTEKDLIKNSLKKKYVEALFLPDNREKKFIELNNIFIMSNCYYESIIRDLVED